MNCPHYGLQRFLTEDEYTAQMLKLFNSDMRIKAHVLNWARSSQRVRRMRRKM